MNQLLLGRVWHRRSGAPANEFSYPALYVDVDLATLDDARERPRLLGRNRFNAYAINDRDHHSADGAGFPQAIPELFDSELGVVPARIRLITQPSSFGYVFNPVSFYIGEDADGGIEAVIAEVHNRRGGRHLYRFLNAGGEGEVRAEFEKRFYVSPFLDMEGTYRFQMTTAGDRLVLGFDLLAGDTTLLETALTVRATPLTDGALLRAMATHPLTPQRTLLGIYRQALGLKLRGARYRRPEPEADTSGVAGHG